MTWCLLLPFRLPGLNEILEGRAHAATGWSAYNQTKQKLAAQVILLARLRGLGRLDPGYFTYLLLEPSKRRDPSNAVSGAVKIVEDSLQVGGYLENDGWEHVLGFCGFWMKSDKGGCLVHWRPDRLASKDEMIVLLEKEQGHGNSNDGPRASDHEPSRAYAAQAPRGRAKPRGKLGRHP